MLYATPPKPPTAEPTISTGNGNAWGASGYAIPLIEKQHAQDTIDGPTPIRFCSRLATSAPAIEPTDPTAKTDPTSTDERCRLRTA